MEVASKPGNQLHSVLKRENTRGGGGAGPVNFGENEVGGKHTKKSDLPVHLSARSTSLQTQAAADYYLGFASTPLPPLPLLRASS
jgi:hypothetical protein